MKRIVSALSLLACVACTAPENDIITPVVVDTPKVPVTPVSPAPPVSPDSVFVSSLRARLESATTSNQFSGAVLVIREGRTLFEGAYGRADREGNVANEMLTQFRVGSMNKMLTAVAILQLVHEGKVRLDMPLNTYLPDYPNADLASRV